MLNMAAGAQDKTLPGNCIELELPGVTPKRWLKGAAIYGANASGKTTIIEALQALASMVTTSAKMTDPKDRISQIEPFSFCRKGAESPTAFEVMFLTGGQRYAYCVAATQERVWHESLRTWPTANMQTWFCRQWNAELAEYDWSPERPSGFIRDTRLERDTLPNMLFLSKHIASNRTELEPIFRWFKEDLVFLDLSTRAQMGSGFTLKQIEEKTALSNRIVELLRHADIGVTGARAVEIETPKGLLEVLSHMPSELQESARKRRWVEPELVHRGADDEEFPLPWQSESAGTHRLFSLIGPWLDILQNGSTVFVDELETSMHPIMVMELLRLLFSDRENPKGAQIIFTTHNPLLLDTTLMRRDQVWFTDKDTEGEGHFYPLTDYSPRKDESLIRGYMSGRYGAVPFVPKGLLGLDAGYEVLDKEKACQNE